METNRFLDSTNRNLEILNLFGLLELEFKSGTENQPNGPNL